MPSKNIKINDTWLTIANYKEPLKAIPARKGFGFYGTLLMTPDGDKVMCHKCGELFSNLGRHVLNQHKELGGADGYREEYDLAYKTALVSETERMALKQRMLDYLATLTPEQMAQHKANARKGLSKRTRYQPRIRLETKNKRGTCPDQLLAKIMEVKDKVGHTPTLREFIRETGTQRYKHLIIKTFGGWNNALTLLGLTLNNPNPSQKGTKHLHHTSEELLEMLRLYAQENRKLPTATDCKVGVLPSYEVFQRHFGSFESARQQAGVYQLIEQ